MGCVSFSFFNVSINRGANITVNKNVIKAGASCNNTIVISSLICPL